MYEQESRGHGKVLGLALLCCSLSHCYPNTWELKCMDVDEVHRDSISFPHSSLHLQNQESHPLMVGTLTHGDAWIC